MEMSEQLVSMTDRSGCKYRSTEGFTKTALESAAGWLFLNNLSWTLTCGHVSIANN